jgi:GNAT superfamily N-acetyltransferase
VGEPLVLADAALARRLEWAEARANADFAEARAQAVPGSGAEWIEVGGTIAVFDGPDSPLTQTFGLGIGGPVTSDDLTQIERFFHERRAPVFHEVSPLADASVLGLLNGRGYQPCEFTSVLCRPISTDLRLDAAPSERIRVRIAGDREHDLFAEVAARGWSEFPGLTEFLRGLALVGAHRTNAVSFFAESGELPIATGQLCLCDGVALLAGASTVPEARRRGAQTALLEARLRHAAGQGCDIAMMGATPGSASQRNAQRRGFSIAYTRVKWRLGAEPGGHR